MLGVDKVLSENKFYRTALLIYRIQITLPDADHIRPAVNTLSIRTIDKIYINLCQLVNGKMVFI